MVGKGLVIASKMALVVTKPVYDCPFTLLYNQLNSSLEILLTPFIGWATYLAFREAFSVMNIE